MLTVIKKSLCVFAILTTLTGVAYPLLVSGLGGALFPDQAHGSLIVRDGKISGSRLIGRAYDDPKYFWGRLSATSRQPYDARASAGSNLGPTNEALTKAAKRRIAALRAADPGNESPIPVDLVTSSASGLDPHVSPEAVRWQTARVARARGVDEARVARIVDEHTEEKTLGILGARRVNVVLLNDALDAL